MGLVTWAAITLIMGTSDVLLLQPMWCSTDRIGTCVWPCTALVQVQHAKGTGIGAALPKSSVFKPKICEAMLAMPEHYKIDTGVVMIEHLWQ